MPRAARFVIPDVPLHLVQRGNNRGPCFIRPRDYFDYLDLLRSFSRQYECRVHAYCLMTNHVHLLLTPPDATSCGRMMKELNQRYVQRINRQTGRSGSLWSGRFHSSIVDSDHYVLACYRYIELNPVRAGLVSSPDEYRWSSYRANAEGHRDPLLSPHPTYQSLSTESYRRLCEIQLDDLTVERIRKATRGGYRMGMERRPRGRPSRQKMGYVPI